VVEPLGDHPDAARDSELNWLLREPMRVTPVTLQIKTKELPAEVRRLEDPQSRTGFILQEPGIALDEMQPHFVAHETRALYLADSCRQFGLPFPPHFLLGGVTYAQRTSIMYYLEPAVHWAGRMSLFLQVNYAMDRALPTPPLITRTVHDAAFQLQALKGGVPLTISEAWAGRVLQVTDFPQK